LLTRTLTRTGLSPEALAEQHASWVAYYSGRQLRRYLKVNTMPDHLYYMLSQFNLMLDAQER